MDNKYRGRNSNDIRSSNYGNDELDLDSVQNDLFDRYKKNINKIYYRDLADMIVNGYSEEQIRPEVNQWEEKSRKNPDGTLNDRRVMYKTNEISDEPLLGSSPIMKSNPKRNNNRSLRKSNSDIHSSRRNDGYRGQRYHENGQYYANDYYNDHNNNNNNNNKNNGTKRNNSYYNRGNFYPNSVSDQFFDDNHNATQPYSNFNYRGKYVPPKSQLIISNNSKSYQNNMRRQFKRNYYNDDNYYQYDCPDQYYQNNYHYKKNYNGYNSRNYNDYPNQNNQKHDNNRLNKSMSNNDHINDGLNTNNNRSTNTANPNIPTYSSDNNTSNYRNNKPQHFSSEDQSNNTSIQHNYTINNLGNNRNNSNLSNLKVIDDDICLMDIPSPPPDQPDPIPFEHTIKNSPIVRPSQPVDVLSITHKLDSSTRTIATNYVGTDCSSTENNLSVPNRPGRRAVSEIENKLFEDARKNIRSNDKVSPVQVFSVGTTRTTSKLSANAPVYNSQQNLYLQPMIAFDQGQYPLYYYPPVDYVPLVTYQYTPYDYPYYNMYHSVYNNYPNNLPPNNTNISTSYPTNSNTVITDNNSIAKSTDQTHITSYTTSKTDATNPIIIKPISESDIKS